MNLGSSNISQGFGGRAVLYLLCVDGCLKREQDFSFFPLPSSDSISNTQRNSALHQIGSLAWHHVRHNRWHLSAGFEGLLIFTDMQSVRLLFRLRASEIKCPGENPFIRDSLSAALHMEVHPSPFALYLWPISPVKTSSESPLLAGRSGCTGKRCSSFLSKVKNEFTMKRLNLNAVHRHL